MTIPANFNAAIDSADVLTARWLEIEGVPACYGTLSKSSSWFSSRGAADRFEIIKPHFKTDSVPANFDGELDPLDGIAKIMGSIEFTIVDIDDVVTTWLGNAKRSDWVYLAADISTSDATIGYTGAGSAFGSTGTLYIGTETITYTGHNTGTKQFTGCTRAKYRSKAQAFGTGFPISPRPVALRGRRCWYYQVAIRRDGAYSDDDKVLRFAGTLEGLRMASGDDGPGAYVLTIHSLEKMMSRKIFRNLRTIRDGDQGISDALGKEEGIRVYKAPGSTPGSYKLWSPDVGLVDDLSWICLLIDDEIVGFLRNGNYFEISQRGMFNTPIEAHRKGWVGKEIAWICPYFAGTFSREHTFSKFTTTMAPAATHPLMVLLQLMVGTGLGTNWSGAGTNYDVLPKDWCLGIDHNRVDIAGFEKLALEHPDLRLDGVIEESPDFIEFAKQVLRPYGFYGTNTVGDLWSVRYMRPPTPDEISREVSNEHRINGYRPGWDANLSSVVREVVFKYGWDITKKDYAHIVVNRFRTANVFGPKDEEGRSIEYLMPLVYPEGGTIPGKPPASGSKNVELFLLDRGDFFESRFVRPQPVINERVDYSFLDCEVGDVVSMTQSYLPNVGTAERGLVDAIGQVIKKRIDDRAKVIDLTILDSGRNLGDYRFISPSLEVESTPAADTIVYKANAFTEPIINGLAQTDAQVRDTNGTLVDAFVAGLYCLHVSTNFATREVLRIQSINFGTRTIVFEDAPTIAAFAAGQYILYSPYYVDNDAFGQKSTYAWMADDTLDLGGVASAHRYYP